MINYSQINYIHLLGCYKNREEYRNKENATELFISENQIVCIKKIKADTKDKNSTELLQIKLIDGSSIVIEDNQNSRRAIFT